MDSYPSQQLLSKVGNFCSSSKLAYNAAVFLQHFRKKGREFTHPVNVINELNENIDFIHPCKITYNVNLKQVKFDDIINYTISAIKETVLPTITSTVVNTKFRANPKPEAKCIANTCDPRTPKITGIPFILSIDMNNNCKIVIENVQHLTLHCKNDILGIIVKGTHELIPFLDEHFILYTDHKPFEKLGYLHNKTLNILQSALLE